MCGYSSTGKSRKPRAGAAESPRPPRGRVLSAEDQADAQFVFSALQRTILCSSHPVEYRRCMRTSTKTTGNADVAAESPPAAATGATHHSVHTREQYYLAGKYRNRRSGYVRTHRAELSTSCQWMQVNTADLGRADPRTTLEQQNKHQQNNRRQG